MHLLLKYVYILLAILLFRSYRFKIIVPEFSTLRPFQEIQPIENKTTNETKFGKYCSILKKNILIK